jgi:hypothetical protein
MFLPDPKTWFARVLVEPGLDLAALTPDIAIEASWRPDDYRYRASGAPSDRYARS